MLGARLTGTAINVTHDIACPEIGPVCALRDEPPQIHDLDFLLAELRLTAEYGVTRWLSLEAQLPFRVNATTATFRRLDGTAFVPDVPDIHHRTETLLGLGDAWLHGILRTRLARWFFAGRLGATLPLGRTEENPFALGRAGLSHQHVQFGSGTVNPLAGADAFHTWERAQLRFSVQALVSAWANANGFQAGSRFSFSAAFDGRPTPTLGLGLGVDAVAELPERWNGLVEQDGNVGRVDVLAGGQVAWTVGRVTLLMNVRVPVVQHFFVTHHGAGQLRYPGLVSVGLLVPVDVGP
ncbi:MAG: hypothetical protein SFW67_07060 [Myxococcaceae bacterium]|nr:hypothetical protein [Myxococcaceae bacterium]